MSCITACAHIFTCLLFPCICTTELLKVSSCSMWPFQAKHQVWWISQQAKIPKSVTVSLSSILLSFPNPILHIFSLSISSCPSVPLLFFSSFVSSLPYSPSTPFNLHIALSLFRLSLSLSPLHRLRLLDWQCRHAEVNWDVAAMTGPLYWFVHLHHPSWCPCRAQTHTYKHTCTHTNTQRSQQEEACPGPKPSKLITLPWWSGPVNLARPQCWRENERIASVSVTTWASVETINKMNRHKAGSAAQWAMEMCIASSAFLSLFIGGNWLLLWLWLPALFFIFFVHVLLL